MVRLDPLGRILEGIRSGGDFVIVEAFLENRNVEGQIVRLWTNQRK